MQSRQKTSWEGPRPRSTPVTAAAASTTFSGMTTSRREDSGLVDREGLTNFGSTVAVAVIGTLISSAVSSLTRLQPVAVFAAAAGFALLVVTNLWLQQTTVASRAVGRATISLVFAYALLWLAAYLLVRSL